MKNIVFYHNHCADGFGAAYFAWLALGEEESRFLAVNYGQVQTPADMQALLDEDTDAVYVLDFSFPPEVMNWLRSNVNKVVWLDHHKTSFEMMGLQPGVVFEEADGELYTRLDNSRSGAYLAAEYFLGAVPRLIRHIDDRDRWQFEIPGSREVHAALQLEKPWTFERWHELMLEDDRCARLIRTGAAALKVHHNQISELKSNAVACDLDGEIGLAINSPVHMSEIGNELAQECGTFGLIWYYDAETEQVNCSLRSVGDYDVSALARRYGGGGHKNAAGFRAPIQQVMEWL